MSDGTAFDKIVTQVDALLSEIPNSHVLDNLGVPKAYAALGLGAFYMFLVVFNFGGAFLVNLAAYFLPAYLSLRSISVAGEGNPKQWVSYWVIFSSFGVVEHVINLAGWIPFYYLFKLAFLAWLALPKFQGAAVFYDSLKISNYFAGRPSVAASTAEKASKTQ